MNCAEFQKKIPQIINNEIEDANLNPVIGHLESCPDCREELEIYYVLHYGLDDDNARQSMNLVERLEHNISKMKKKQRRNELADSIYNAVIVISGSVIFASLVYVLFFMKK